MQLDSCMVSKTIDVLAAFTRDGIRLELIPTGKNKPCIYMRPGRSTLDQFSYLVPNKFTCESDPVWNCTILVWYSARVNPAQFRRIRFRVDRSKWNRTALISRNRSLRRNLLRFNKRSDTRVIRYRVIKATFTWDWICSDPFGIGSTLLRIHFVYTGPVLNWNGTVPHRITFISGPIWYQIADPIRTGSTRSRVTTRLIRTNFVPAPNGFGPV